MDSLSYLIENNNEVIIDEKLLQELQQKNQPPQQQQHQPQQQPLDNSGKADVKGTRKYSPMNRNSKRSPHSNTVLKTETTKTETAKTIPVESRLFNEEESIGILAAKVESLKQGQRQMEEKYGAVIANLRGELNKRNSEYEQQCEEFGSIKGELAATKKDIAALIGMLKKGSAKEADSSKKILSPSGKGAKGNVLSGFSKSSKNIL